MTSFRSWNEDKYTNVVWYCFRALAICNFYLGFLRYFQGKNNLTRATMLYMKDTFDEEEVLMIFHVLVTTSFPQNSSFDEFHACVTVSHTDSYACALWASKKTRSRVRSCSRIKISLLTIPSVFVYWTSLFVAFTANNTTTGGQPITPQQSIKMSNWVHTITWLWGWLPQTLVTNSSSPSHAFTHPEDHHNTRDPLSFAITLRLHFDSELLMTTLHFVL